MTQAETPGDLIHFPKNLIEDRTFDFRVAVRPLDLIARPACTQKLLACPAHGSFEGVGRFEMQNGNDEDGCTLRTGSGIAAFIEKQERTGELCISRHGLEDTTAR